MPRKTARNKLPLKERERLFVDRYIEKGANESAIPEAERLASLEPGSGSKILKRVTVQLEVLKKTEPLRLAQMQRDSIASTVELAAKRMLANLQAQIAVLTELGLVDKLLNGAIAEIIANPENGPEAKMKAITMGKVELGRWETPQLTLKAPLDGLQGGSGLYAGIFTRMPPQAQPWPPVQPQDAPKPTIEAPKQLSAPLPPPGESIEEVPETKTEKVMTVHVGAS